MWFAYQAHAVICRAPSIMFRSRVGGCSIVLVGDDPAAREGSWLWHFQWCGFVVAVVYSYAIALLSVKFTD